jgi:hypothetical protein
MFVKVDYKLLNRILSYDSVSVVALPSKVGIHFTAFNRNILLDSIITPTSLVVV